ncbi:MAG TPA: CtsR family transcriptional regulator [Clostridiales bacterium]|nr:CtsR family transcriptional regulator [Clostridiales bacterium]
MAVSRVSDIIEIFIKELLEEADDCAIEIQRNELANYFNCAPSQINYVLTTRFSLDKGYLIESRRGGGGHIKIIKMDMDRNRYIQHLLNEIGDSISQMKATSIINTLQERKLISEREGLILRVATSDQSLSIPINIKNRVRANLLKSILIAIFQDGGK